MLDVHGLPQRIIQVDQKTKHSLGYGKGILERAENGLEAGAVLL